ncbi:MAG: DUF1854 domain-containing protein [Gemmatimonadales bacterium]
MNAELASPATAPVRLERREDGALRVRLEAREVEVTVRRCFPWSEPTRHLSLRDQNDEEILLVERLDRLDPRSRRALETALAEAGFVFVVERVLAVEEEVEIRDWRVETAQGPRRFQTRLDDWPRSLPDGGTLIRDVAGDLYRVPPPAELDPRSRELLWAFVD